MGEQNVKLNDDEATHQAFMKSLITEVHALEKMLDSGLIETGVRRIGAEQEKPTLPHTNWALIA